MPRQPGGRMWNDERPTHTLDECHRLLDRIIATVEPLILAHVQAEGADAPSAGGEAQRRLGYALWDIFSRNHSVTDADGVYSLGTFRSSGDEIAEALMRLDPDARYEYLDFYMGSSLSGVEMGHEYRLIFRQLRAEGCDWTYSFPRFYLARFDRAEEVATTDHYLSQEVAESLDGEKESPADDLASALDRMHDEEVARARNEPLPGVVFAYREVYGRLPVGWPHPEM